jgi:hypothetical protein
MQPEITSTLTTLQNCICLLFPTPEDFFIQDRNEAETEAKMSDEKPGSTDCSIIKQTEDEKNNEEHGLEHKDRLSELNTSDKKLEQSKNTVKNEYDTPSISEPDDNTEEENSDVGSETSDSVEDTDFRAHGMLSSKYSIEVNVNTGICQ